MENLTILIPYFNGGSALVETLKGIPGGIPIIVIDDSSDTPLDKASLRKDIEVIRPDKKRYFTGAVNAGIERCNTDVLVLNQDVKLQGVDWLNLLSEKREAYAIIGESITGLHPAWPKGYAHGTFWFLRRDLINQIGLLNEVDYPLWGSTCEYQLRACRKGYKALPTTIPGFIHRRRVGYGDAIIEMLRREPAKRDRFIRTPPMISVVVPCFNYGRFLPDLVNSMIGGETCLGYMPGQTFQSFEIVITDDASTDKKTKEILSSIADDWKGIRVVQQRENKGTAASLNTAVRHSFGWVIAALDADDMMEYDRLERLYRVLEKNTHSIVYDDMQIFADGKRGRKYPIAKEYDFDKLLSKNHVPAGIMFTRRAWKAVGGWPEEFGNGRQDWSMAVRLGSKGYCGVKVDGVGYLYRREAHNRTLGNVNPRARQEFLKKMMRVFPELYSGKRPPGCCGKEGKSIFVTPGQTKMAKAKGGKSTGVSVFLRYIGRNWGTQSFKGITGTVYSFGKTRALGAVDKADVKQLLSIRENGKRIFVIEAGG